MLRALVIVSAPYLIIHTLRSVRWCLRTKYNTTRSRTHSRHTTHTVRCFHEISHLNQTTIIIKIFKMHLDFRMKMSHSLLEVRFKELFLCSLDVDQTVSSCFAAVPYSRITFCQFHFAKLNFNFNYFFLPVDFKNTLFLHWLIVECVLNVELGIHGAHYPWYIYKIILINIFTIKFKLERIEVRKMGSILRYLHTGSVGGYTGCNIDNR